MTDRHDSAPAFRDLSDYFGRVIDRMWEMAPESEPETGDSAALLADMRNAMRALMMGPAGLPLLLSARNRELVHRLLYIYGLVEQRADGDHRQLKDLTKEVLLAWLELGDEARRHRDELWKINTRLLQKIGEAIEEVTAEFSGRKP